MPGDHGDQLSDLLIELRALDPELRPRRVSRVTRPSASARRLSTALRGWGRRRHRAGGGQDGSRSCRCLPVDGPRPLGDGERVDGIGSPLARATSRTCAIRLSPVPSRSSSRRGDRRRQPATAHHRSPPHRSAQASRARGASLVVPTSAHHACGHAHRRHHGVMALVSIPSQHPHGDGSHSTSWARTGESLRHGGEATVLSGHKWQGGGGRSAGNASDAGTTEVVDEGRVGQPAETMAAGSSLRDPTHKGGTTRWPRPGWTPSTWPVKTSRLTPTGSAACSSARHLTSSMPAGAWLVAIRRHDRRRVLRAGTIAHESQLRLQH